MAVELNDKQKLLLGEWKLESSENFDNYMKEIGIGLLKRKAGAVTKPNLKLSFDGTEWKVQVISTFKNDEWHFKLNEKARHHTIDGREFYIVAELTDDGKMIERQSNVEGDNSVTSVITRWVDEQGRLVAHMKANNVEAYRYYVRA
ncbi:unnamed protein product [Bursaphelenchus okinawaensis]|uniref:Lipocalin/cytosolic fatty-acid binding domain-containing protein n=1 Tax=Bursaphelenchus okinawaensis TaxID=465554 RepID=A0A811JR28_9BILA|nr:unnamed protein product [Bursaphelenchus okinawaensis]CAG9078786.1 unnamed protein product [Bursaphelenchus okinawaensis]